MFGISTIQGYLSIGLAAVILMMAATIVVLDKKLDTKNDQLIQAKADTATAVANIETVKVANVIMLASFEETLEQIETHRIAEIELNSELRRLESYTNELQDKLSRHDLEALSLAKPVLVENIINNATADVMQSLEDITGNTP